MTLGLRYCRLHGIGEYRHEYTNEELDALKQACENGDENYILFNNVSMWPDAIKFQELLR